MDVSSINQRQKRAKFWADFLENEPMPASLKTETAQLLSEFRALLAEVAQRGNHSDNEEARMLDMERRLTELNESARLRSAYD